MRLYLDIDGVLHAYCSFTADPEYEQRLRVCSDGGKVWVIQDDMRSDGYEGPWIAIDDESVSFAECPVRPSTSWKRTPSVDLATLPRSPSWSRRSRANWRTLQCAKPPTFHGMRLDGTSGVMHYWVSQEGTETSPWPRFVRLLTSRRTMEDR